MKTIILVCTFITSIFLQTEAQPTTISSTPKFIPWVIRISGYVATWQEGYTLYTQLMNDIETPNVGANRWMRQYKDQIGVFNKAENKLYFVGVLPDHQRPNDGHYYAGIFHLFYTGAEDIQVCALTNYTYCKCDLKLPCW